MIKNFQDLGIEPEIKHFLGAKLKVSKVLNKEIKVIDYEIKPSNYKGECLHMQIEIGTQKHVFFTGSSVLINTIKRITKSNLPFMTTIVEENEHYQFT